MGTSISHCSRYIKLSLKGVFAFLLIFFASSGFGQTPGYIFRPATTVIKLDPNLDHYSSQTTAGFTTNDITQSEIGYKPIPVPYPEPTSDLRRGSNCNVTDIVPDANGVGAYAYYDGTNLLFRMRMGGYSNGSFGYSILIDMDQKFGNVGPNADPTYFAQTTGNNGNPGFEYEIVWEKNFRVAVYDVNNTGTTPVFLSSFTESTNTQSSKNLTTNCSDPDYFMDFYIPLSALSGGTGGTVTASTPIRICITTCMSPAPSIGGTKSDIYGVNDALYPIIENAWTKIINFQPPFTPTDIGSGGSGIGSVCTAPPALNSPITNGVTSVSGTWTTASSQTTATISVYKNTSTLIGTVTGVASGNTWTLSSISPALATNDVISAKAQATGESMCLTSNIVTVSACNSSNLPTTPALGCTTGTKGITGTNLSTGWTVHVDNLTRGIFDNDVTNSTGLFAKTGTSPNITWTYDGGCSGGPGMATGSFKVYYVNNVTGCSSIPVYYCDGGTGNGQNVLLGTLPVPTITSPSNGVFTKATSSISGTTTAGAQVFLYIGGINVQTTTATAGTFTFSGLSLLAGQTLYIVVELNTGTVSTSYCESQTTNYTVGCVTSIPIITADANNNIAAGILISGTSSEAAGATVTVYNAVPAVVGTGTVLSNGTWASTATSVSGTSYHATQTFSTCGVSDASAIVTTIATNAVCPVITGTPISESATTISGTITPAVNSTTIRLYEDGVLIGTAITTTTSWGPITISSSYPLYPGGQLSVTCQRTGVTPSVESSCAASVTVACVAPAAPSVTPTTYTTCYNTTISVPVTGSVSGIIYTLKNSAGTSDLGTSILGTGGSITLTSYPITTSQTIRVYASKIGSYVCESYTSIIVTVNNVTGGVVAGNQSIPYQGDPAAFTESTGSTFSGILSYQWQSSTTSASAGFGNIGGAISATYDPPPGLTQTTWYKRLTYSTQNSIVCPAESNVISVSVLKTFNCSGTSYWDNLVNWGPTGVPALSDNLYIPASCQVHVNITGAICNDLTIANGAALIVDPGKALTINGALVNNSGTSGLVIQSDVTGTGSLICNTTGVDGTVERYLTTDAWHLISAPINNALSGIFIYNYLRPFIESSNTWGDFITPLNTALPAGTGFVCWPITSQAYTFTGILNTGTVSPGLTWTDINHGNNLVGNPYPSAIDWNAGSGWTKTNIGGTIWIWNPASGGNYGSWNGSSGTNSVTQYIPVGQGFFVQATGAPTLSMTNDVRVHNTQTFLKNSDLPNALRLHAQNSYGSDEIVAYFDPESSWVYDPQIDSRKMFGDAMAPQLFSFKPGDPEELSINVLPEIKNPLVVPVSLEVGLNGQYSITASQMESFPANVSLYLEDLKLSKTQNLRVNPVYTFAADTNDIAHRFNLHFSNFPFGIPGPADDNAFRIYSYGQTIYINSNAGISENAQLFVYDLIGKELFHGTLSNQSLNRFSPDVVEGYYLVRVMTNQGVYNAKVYLR